MEGKLEDLREPFKDNEIGKLPKPTKKGNEKGKCELCKGFHGLPAVHLDYVGHAELTSRLLDVDPFWQWEPYGVSESGLPQLDKNGGLWIKLTILGLVRIGYGDPGHKAGEPDGIKEAIGDGIRNAAMRFGCALGLWKKSEDRDIGYVDAKGKPNVTRKAQSPPPPSKKQGEPLAAKAKAETTNNFQFLKVMADLKKKLGEPVYYIILKEAGFNHANEILASGTQEIVWRQMDAKAGGKDA